MQSASPSADFSSLAAAPLLVLSASSFAWWPAFLGAARAVVAPRWGVAAPHAWAPDALAAPGVKVWQDMSLPPRASASASGEARGRDGVRRALLVAYAAAAPAGEGGESGAALDEESFPGGATGVAYAARATDGGRVLNVAVRGWGRWPGNTGEALARLRDC